MNIKVNPTLVGLFIVVGLALGVAGVLLVSAPGFFADSRTYILYFDGSLRGLNPGAAVKYRGVTIGSVREVMIRFNQHPSDLCLPVLIEIRKRLVRGRMEARPGFDLEAEIDERIHGGLRGTLRSDSLVTGLLYVELEERPEVEAVFHQIEEIYLEIPTAPTETQELFERLARLMSDLLGVPVERHLLIGLQGVRDVVDRDVVRAVVDESLHRTPFVDVSSRFAASWRTRRAAVMPACMSAIGNATPWKSPIRRPNACRCRA